MTEKTAVMPIERFTNLLEAYGSRVERLPAVHQTAARRLLVADAKACAAHDEARALDALLDRADEPVGAFPGDLADRIVAAALMPRVVATSDRRPAPGSNAVSPALRPELQRTALARHSSPFDLKRLPAAAALAASLVLGIAIGSHDLVSAPMRGLIEMARIDDHDTGLHRLVSSLHSDGVSAAIDEDIQ